MTQIRAEENWWMPGESYSTKNAKLVSNTFKYNFLMMMIVMVLMMMTTTTMTNDDDNHEDDDDDDNIETH